MAHPAHFGLPSFANSTAARWAAVLVVVAASALGLGAERPRAAACGWRPGEVLELSGAVTEGGLTGPFQRQVELGSGRTHEAVDLAVVASGHGYDGRLAWSQDVSGAVHDLDSGFAQALARSEAWLAGGQGQFGCGLRSRVRRVGVTFAAGRPLEVREVTPAGGASIEVWYDAATGLPDRAILQYPENRIIRRFSDWREVGAGRRVAFEQRDEDPEDGDDVIYRVAEARLLPKATAAMFARPEHPNDVRIRNGGRSTTIAYQDDDRTRIYLPVYLDGAGPFAFELDNGGHFILSPETLKALGGQAQGDFSSTGAGTAVARAGYARIHELRIGEAVISDQPAKVRPLSAAANDRGARPPRAGILGIELFERFTVAIDRRAHSVTLTPRGAPYPRPRGRPLPIVFAEDAPLTPGAFEGAPGDFMLDIGNAGPTIIEQTWAEPRGLTGRFAAGIAMGDSVLARGALSLGALRLPDELVSYYGRVALGSEATHAVAGVLGEPLLSRFDMTYDLARKTVWVSSVPGVGLKPFNRSGLTLAKVAGGDFRVVGVAPGSPADHAGLHTGALIEAVDGKPAASLSRADVSAVLEQPEGTAVQLTVHGAAEAPRTLAIRLRKVL